MTTHPFTLLCDRVLQKVATLSTTAILFITLILFSAPAFAANTLAHETYQTLNHARQLSLKLRKAANAGNTKQVLSLLAQGVDASYLGFRGLVRYIQPGSEAILDLLLSRGAGDELVSSNGQSLIYAAIAANNPTAVAILLRYHAPVDAISTSVDPLSLALLRGMTGVAIALTKAGANPDRISAHGNAVDVAQAMLDVGYLEYLASVPPKPDRATTQKVRLALRMFGDSSEVNRTGPWNKMLTLGTETLQRRLGLPPHGHPSLALLDALSTALQAVYLNAARSGSVAKLRRLGANFPNVVKAKDSAGLNALMLASYYGRSKAVNFLIGSNAPISAVSNNGSNSILLAVLGRAHFKNRTLERNDIIASLVAAGANTALKNADGVSANSIAQEDPHLAAMIGISPHKPPNHFYIAVLSRPQGQGWYGWHCSKNWPSQWIVSQWNKQSLITSVSRAAGRWCIVTGPFLLGDVGQATRDVTTGLSTVSSDMKQQGKTLTDFAASSGASMAVYTDGKGDTDGWVYSNTIDLSDIVKNEVWAKGWRVDRVVPSATGEWMVVYGDMMGYGSQAIIHGSLKNVVGQIQAVWQKGLLVTSLSHRGTTWCAVASTGTNEKDQSFIMATSFDSLASKIKAAFANGQWGVDIITGGRLGSAALTN